MKTRNIVIKLPVEDIYPHPNNPRKNLGDLEELTDSVEKNGLMQNLTVMPGHWSSEDGKWYDKGYTLLIGHRRCEAARRAGLERVPCLILEDVSEVEQIGIMLEENMQRNDLTVYEQAESFQMMLDLGETVESLTEKTGFSKTTIYHRANLAKLNKEKLKEIEADDSFQLSLKDLYELEKIKDIDKRNEILSTSSTSANLKWKVEQAIREEQELKLQQSIEELFEKNNIPEAPEEAKDRWNRNWVALQTFTWDKEPEIEVEITDDVRWTKYWNTHALVAENRNVNQIEDDDEKNKVNKRKDEIKDELEKIDKSIQASINTFYEMAAGGKVELLKDTDEVWNTMLILDVSCDIDYLILTIMDEIPDAYEEADEYEAAVSRALKIPVEQQMLIFVLGELKGIFYFSRWNVRIYQHNAKRLEKVMGTLKKYGFSLSDEQQQFLDETHPLFAEYEKLISK